MKRPMLAFAIVVLGASTPAAAQQMEPPEVSAFRPAQGPADDPLGRHFFPPELVMSNQRAIGLEDAQREAIMQAVRYGQAVFGELQMRMAGEMERLVELLQAPTVDSTASLAQLDRVLMHEHQVKRAHIAILIGIRNVLTAEQRRRLEAIRSGRRSSGF
jgi:Spy/CpxP family protein refolding chaperone